MSESRAAAWGLVLCLFGTVGCEARGAPHPTFPTSIHVSLCDVAGAPGQTLNVALATATQALASARVSVRWSVECQGVPTPGEMNVLIVRQPPKQARVSAFSLGATDHDSVRAGHPTAWVFLERTCEFQRMTNQGAECPDIDILLGYAIAHEVGHMLGWEHRPHGIMAAKWTRETWLAARSGRLLF